MRSLLIISLFFLNYSLQAANTAPTSSSGHSKASSSSNPTQIDLKTQMSSSLQKQTGISKLTSEQVENLQGWISDYVQKKTTSNDKVAANQVSTVLSEGQYVQLGNGETWTISPNAWIYTFYWQKGDPVDVGKSGDVLFPIQLTNENSGQAVNAKTSSKEVSSAFKQSYQIIKIIDNGQYIELSNGSSWKVQPSARYMVQGWSTGSSVFVVKNTVSTGAPYVLYNGDTTRNVFVSQERPPSKPTSKKNTSTSSTQTNASKNTSQ